MKIASGKFKGVPLFCSDVKVRPTLIKIRQAVFNIIRPVIYDSIFIDLFAGTGAFGFEALSNGAAKVFLIDRHNKGDLIKNINKLKLEKEMYEIISLDYNSALKLLKKDEIKADIIFADPPYNKGYVAQLIKNDIIKEIIKPDGIFIIEIFKKEKVNLESFLNDWKIDKEKIYGDTHILFLKSKEKKYV